MLMSQATSRLLILNADHEILFSKGSTTELVSFTVNTNQALEMSLRDYLVRKLGVGNIRFLGMANLPQSGLIPAVLLLDEEFTPPKGLVFLELADALKQSDLAFAAYCEVMLGGFIPSSRDLLAWPLGDNEIDGSLLGSMAARGLKTGSSSLLIEYGKNQSLLPKDQQVSVIIDWESRPICVIQTEKVSIVPFGKVGADQATADALGDGSLTYWQDVHWELFSAICAENKEEMGDDMDVVCERFRCLKSLI